MTSNIGSFDLIDNLREDGTIPDDVKDKVENQLKAHFRPEFLNRVDDIVIFSPLTKIQVEEIIQLTAADIAKRLAGRNISLEIDEKGSSLIADKAYDPAYGARPIKRYLQKNIETTVAAMIIKGQVGDGDKVTVTAKNDRLEYLVNA